MADFRFQISDFKLKSGFGICVLLILAAVTQAAEMRGIWVDAFHPGFKSPTETLAMVAKAKDCNFNAIFVQVRKRGDVYYTSSIEPMAKEVTPGYDPLADIVTKAHAAGLEVHAWISTLEVYHDVTEVTADSRQVHLTHREWLMKDHRGRSKFPGNKVFLDPGVPEVREYVAGMVEEIVRKYNVEGIHLDIARYPSKESGYNETSVARFNQETSRSSVPAIDDATWSNWRRARLTELVRTIYQRSTAIKPNLKVSAAVFANKTDASANRFQDWENWMRAGILDFAVPMDFALDNGAYQLVASQVSSTGHGRHIYLGQGGWKMPAAKALEQITMARQDGFGGIVVYSYAYCSKPQGEQPSLMDQLKTGPFAQADALPAMGWK